MLPRSQVTEVNDRLRAVGDLMSNMPLPKDPMPKGMRAPVCNRPDEPYTALEGSVTQGHGGPTPKGMRPPKDQGKPR